MSDIIGPANAVNAVTVRPPDTRSFLSLDSWFKDCTSPTTDDGTDVTASWLNGMVASLRQVWRGNGNRIDGVTPVIPEVGTDDAGVLKSIQQLIQRGQLLYAEDSSATINLITATLSPAAIELKAGLTVAVKAATTNTGAVKMNLNALGEKDVVRPNGLALLDSDVVAGSIHSYRYDGTKWQLLGAPARPVLARATTLHVNGAIGNDANDGAANDAAHALATVQGAINLAFRYGPSAFTVTILIHPGAYDGARTPLYSGPSLIIDGQVATSVTVTGLVGTNYSSLSINGVNVATIQNMTVQNSGPAGSDGAIQAAYGASVTVTGNRSNAVGGGIFQARQGGTIFLGSHTYNGSFYAALYAASGNIVMTQSAVHTISAAVTAALAFAFSASSGAISIPGSSVPTFVNPANVTGPKYLCSLNGVVAASGNGVNYFPGSVAGSVSTGGQYA